MKPIPIKAARHIAEEYGYDQVIVIARKVGEGEHCTTYGVDKANCDVAAMCGDFLKAKVMGWTSGISNRRDELVKALRGLMPDGWDDPDGHMDHMPGIKAARLALAKYEFQVGEKYAG